MEKDKIKEALSNTMDSLVSAYDEERKQTDAWQKLFKKVDGLNFHGLLRQAACDMETIALDVYTLIENEVAKAGLQMPKKGVIEVVYALAYLEWALTKTICKTESSICSVDKAFYVLNKHLNDLITTEAMPRNGE